MKKIVTLLGIILASFLITSCGGADSDSDTTSTPEVALVAQEGDTVIVHYVGTLEDGTQFDSSRDEGRNPLEFALGDGQLIAGFDEAVRGMRVGETTDITLAPSEAYGEVVVSDTINRGYLEDLFPGIELSEGITLSTQQGADITIVTLTDEDVEIEFENTHELAGKTLNFSIELLDIIR